METPVIATAVSAATETAVSAEAEETPARGTAVLAAVLNAISAAAQETSVRGTAVLAVASWSYSLTLALQVCRRG